MFYGRGYVTFLFSHVTLRGHIKEICDFVSKSSLTQDTILTSLKVIGLVEVEIYIFFCYVTSCDHTVKDISDLLMGVLQPKSSRHQI